MLLAGSLALLLAAPGATYGQGPAPVKVAPVTQRKVAAGQAFVGTVTPVRRSTVGSAVAGRIVEFRHNEGDYVEEGEVLAQVLTGTIEIELAQAQAELKVREAELAESEKSFPSEKQQADARLAAARARMEHAKSKMKRMQGLRERNSASEEAYDEAKAAALEAEAVFLESEAARRMIYEGAREQKIHRLQAQARAQQEAVNFIKDRLQKYTIKAYFSGYVTAEFTEVGHWVKEGDPVIEIAELDEVEVRVNVPEDHVADLEIGDAVRVDVNATKLKSFVGEVAAIVPQADLKARTFPVLVRLKNPRKQGVEGNTKSRSAGHVLNGGMLARAIFPVGKRREALLVSKDAIVLGGRAPIVFVIDRDPQNRMQGTVRIVPVELGPAIGGEIEAAGLVPDQPLRPGDLVVVEGNERLRPGQVVSFADPPVEPSGAAAARD
ncbi:MAG TPA: efflux RND transporter periplasmic adaptor subunit [Planctomycetaceae bacterium]|nr:efflux RND transporter periplasmic adaptor subunit [Planctomycetaceae bacterium]